MNNQQKSEIEKAFISDGFNLAMNLPIQADKKQITDSIRGLLHQIDLLTDSFTTRCSQNNVPVDCKMGCSWCCHQSVFALTHEMLIVANYIKTKFKPETVNGILSKAKEKSKATKSLSTKYILNTKIACPLLKNGACMAYPVRPMACRIYLSSDLNSCKEKYERPADPDTKPKLFSFMLEAGRNMNYGYVTGLRNKNLISNEAPIEWLLEKILQDEQSFNKWLAGEEINESFNFDVENAN